MDLADAGDAERRRERALAQRRVRRLPRLDVDDDVRAGQHALDRLLDRVRDRVPLRDRGAGRHADDDVGEVAARRLAAAAGGAARPAGSIAAIARRAAASAAARRAIHEHVDVPPHEPPAATRTSTATNSAATESASVEAGAHGEQADEHGERAGEVAGEVERVRRERGAAVARAPHAARRPPGSTSIAITTPMTANAHQAASTSG